MKVIASLFGGSSTKFLTAVLGAGVEAASTGHFDWKTFTAGAATAVGVYLFPNAGKAPQTPV